MVVVCSTSHAAALLTGILECELTEWAVAVGNTVEEFQPLCQVTSDKACVEITSRFAGTVEKLHHAAGDMVQVPASSMKLSHMDRGLESILEPG